MEATWMLEGQYLKSLPTGTPPVDEVRVAARYAGIQPMMAEEAIARAKKANKPGSTGPMVDAIAAEAFCHDCRFESALMYATAAAKKLPADAKANLDDVIFRSA
jgi:hypothetical protein